MVKVFRARPYNVVIVYSKSRKQLDDWFGVRVGPEGDERLSGFAGEMSREDGTDCLHVAIYAKTMDVLVHECVHAAYYVLNEADVKISVDNHEAMSYLVGDIFERCWKGDKTGCLPHEK